MMNSACGLCFSVWRLANASDGSVAASAGDATALAAGICSCLLLLRAMSGSRPMLDSVTAVLS